MSARKSAPKKRSNKATAKPSATVAGPVGTGEDVTPPGGELHQTAGATRRR